MLISPYQGPEFGNQRIRVTFNVTTQNPHERGVFVVQFKSQPRKLEEVKQLDTCEDVASSQGTMRGNLGASPLRGALTLRDPRASRSRSLSSDWPSGFPVAREKQKHARCLVDTGHKLHYPEVCARRCIGLER